MPQDEIQYVYYKQWGNKIFFRYKLNGGVETYSDTITNYQPNLYSITHLAPTTKSIYGDPLLPLSFDTIKEAKEKAEEYKRMGNPIYGNSDFGNQFLIDLYDGADVNYKPEIIRLGFVDIECDVKRGDDFPVPHKSPRPLNAITLYDSIDKCYYVFGVPSKKSPEFNPSQDMGEIDDVEIKYYSFESERELILAFLTHWRDTGYDIISGWNSEGFDVPYIWFRCCKVVGEKYTKRCLSPFGIVNTRETRNKHNKMYWQVDIMGLAQMDYEDVYRKFVSAPRGSYKLGDIGSVELDESKVDYSQYGHLQDFYENNYAKFIRYNIQDVRLIVRLDQKLKLMDLAIAIMYMTSANLQDTLGTVKQWECFIAKELYNNNTAPLYHDIGGIYRSFEGAYVKPVISGFFHWIVSQDLNSLYPHLIMQGWIGPDSHVARETITDQRLLDLANYTVDDYVNKRVDTSVLKEYNYSLAPNGELYDKSKPCFLAVMMERVYGQRKTIKGEMFVHEKRKEFCEHLLQWYEDNSLDKPNDHDVGSEYAEAMWGLSISDLKKERNFQKNEEQKKDLIQHAIKILQQ